ncbi:Ankyrin repeat domain containing protein [Pandoravirus neocaledonia]|uniref:Ankyrin repeat domain containing protein n=1 Tax=Pandoravirus neocaledonia TaxID=2107708 RepID=A0A2U7UE96_9VIRU|nr:Ankyrin repeat domain containing protein [Pandoravirus neocaledonia]AVK76640.1 Ankyrin repeat domain containing protein [Pandoravirus neocaledonia]
MDVHAMAIALADLPVEIRHAILWQLDDRSFVAALNASRLWHVHNDAEYERRARRWRDCTTPRDFCRVGNLDALKTMHGRLAPEDAPAFLAGLWGAAAKYDHVDIVRWLYASGSKPPVRFFEHYAPGPRVLAWLIAHHRKCVARCQRLIVRLAAHRGKADSLRLMHDAGFRAGFNCDTMATAAGGGHLDAVRFLHEHRRDPPSTQTLARAAASGNVELVAFLCEHRNDGCTDDGYIEEAAAKGYVKSLALIHRRYAHLRWEPPVLILAAAIGRVAVVEFLHQHRLVACQPGLERHICDEVARDWLRANGCACCDDATDADLDVLYKATDSDTMAYYISFRDGDDP